MRLQLMVQGCWSWAWCELTTAVTWYPSPSTSAWPSPLLWLGLYSTGVRARAYFVQIYSFSVTHMFNKYLLAVYPLLLSAFGVGCTLIARDCGTTPAFSSSHS